MVTYHLLYKYLHDAQTELLTLPYIPSVNTYNTRPTSNIIIVVTHLHSQASLLPEPP